MGVSLIHYIHKQNQLRKMNKNLSFLVLSALILVFASCSDQKKDTSVVKVVTNDNSSEKLVTHKTLGRAFNFIIVSDWGWNGYKHQQEVADQMEKTADSVGAKFITTCGDNFQVSGIASTQDPLWMANFENVYKGLSLQAEWFPVLGNHDYKGSPQAEIDYSKISRRWRLTEHYYTFAKKINDTVSARFIFLDTPPLVAEYQNKPVEYPEISKQDTAKEIKWLKEVLSNSKEQWIMVFGHHPVYSASQKHGNTPELIKLVKPLLEKYHAQFYFCGHDHDFQHLREKGKNVEYIVTGTGGETRPASSNDLSVFSKSEPGFSVVSLKADSLRICFVGVKGNIIYSFARSYK
jgi:tartrate-resistant acid phosphatase type 5